MMRIGFLISICALLAISAAAAEPASALDPVLVRAEKHAANFLDVFSEVKCTEHVDQVKLSPKGKVEFATQSRYDYLLIAQTADGEMNLQESRLEERAAEHKDNVSLLVTNGFATMILVFHPYYQSAYEFFDRGDELVNGHLLAKIEFKHIHGQRTPTVLLLRGREYPLEMMGTAWVDKDSGAVVRMKTELQVNMTDIGLKALSSDITYSPVKFRGLTVSPWLPLEAKIEVETARQHWRNTHRFENYQHFGVETEHKDDAGVLLSKAK